MKNLLILFSLFTALYTFPQSFELTVSTKRNEAFYYTFENSDSEYISLGGISKGIDNWIYANGLIVKYDNFGNILNYKEFTKEDTTLGFSYGLQKGNGNYFLIGVMIDSIESKRYKTYVCEITPDFEIIWEKIYEMQEKYLKQQYTTFLFTPDSNILITSVTDTSYYSYNHMLYSMSIDINGDLNFLKFYDQWTGLPYSYITLNQDSTEIYLFGEFSRPPYTQYTEFIRFDLEMNILGYIGVIDYDHFITGPEAAKNMPDGNLILANRTSMEPNTLDDLYIKIMDQDFNTLKDTILLYPETAYLATFQGLDFIDPDKIWVTTFYPTFMSLPGQEVFRVHIFDSNLHLKGVKEYGGDTHYWLQNTFVTSDGGCLVTGYRKNDNKGSYNNDAYVIKVMPEDILTNAEETTIDFDKDIIVFPNPFTSEIKVQTLRKSLTFNLFDVKGKQILSTELYSLPNSTIQTGILPAGFYYYAIKDNDLIIQTGKLIRK